MNDFDAVAFYVVAHLDDWQLFMNPNATQDLTDETVKVVFIHTTGYDAGEEEVFWRAKEEAVIASIKTRLSPLRPLGRWRAQGAAPWKPDERGRTTDQHVRRLIMSADPAGSASAPETTLGPHVQHRRPQRGRHGAAAAAPQIAHFLPSRTE